MYEDDRAACFANESQKLARDALFLVLSNLAFHHPDLNLADGFKKLPPGADTSASTEKATHLADKVLSVSSVLGGRRGQPSTIPAAVSPVVRHNMYLVFRLCTVLTLMLVELMFIC